VSYRIAHHCTVSVEQLITEIHSVRYSDALAGAKTRIKEFTHECALSLWLIGTVRAEPETVISRAWLQSPDPAE